MTYKRKKYHYGDTHLKKRWRVRNRKKDLDQIDEDLKEEKAEKLLNQDVDLDLPGAAQHYCLHCARYFIDNQALQEHFKTKVHKRRLKALELEPYSIEESERAAGQGNFKLPNKRKIITQNTDVIDKDGDIVLSEDTPTKKKKIPPVRCSALFINGSNATENYVFVVPHVDFPQLFQEKDMLQSILTRRKSNFDLQKLENLWAIYNDLKYLKLQQDNSKLKLSKELTELLKNDQSDVEKLRIQISLIKENIRNLKIPLWSAEEAAMVEALNFPNSLHKLTPDYKNNVIFEHKVSPSNKKDHNVVGKEKNLIKYGKTNTSSVYLLGDAAFFELGAKFYFSDYLKRKDYTQFSNTDFVKSLVVEGSGVDHTDPTSTFILQHNDNTPINKDKRLHLTGAGSLHSFLAYHAKNVIYSKVLPLKYFSIGRQYNPSKRAEHHDNLFETSQSSVIQIFGVVRDNNELDKLLQEVLDLLKILFNKLDYHYRLSYVSADKLYMWESLRVSIEMFSSSLKKYIEVGHVSLSDDFISKRLMFTYTDNKVSKFPHILSGTILNVPKVLGCVMEQDEEFTLPELFKVENWTNHFNTDVI